MTVRHLKALFENCLRMFLYFFFFPQEGEDAVRFANRVKSAIAVQGGLTELPW